MRQHFRQGLSFDCASMDKRMDSLESDLARYKSLAEKIRKNLERIVKLRSPEWCECEKMTNIAKKDLDLYREEGK